MKKLLIALAIVLLAGMAPMGPCAHCALTGCKYYIIKPFECWDPCKDVCGETFIQQKTESLLGQNSSTVSKHVTRNVESVGVHFALSGKTK